MDKKLILLISFVLLLGLEGNMSATELAVDIAYTPNGTCQPCALGETCGAIPYPNGEAYYLATLKPGWIPWEGVAWGDLSYHDPRILPDIAGSGINATIRCGYEGDTSLKVLGMTFVGDGKCPDGEPNGQPLANSYIISHRHWGNDPNTGRPYWGSIFLTFNGDGLPPGLYTLTSYHNDANNPSIWSGRDWRVDDGFEEMPEITVTGLGVEQLHDGQTYDVNVVIQHETEDDKLIPSVVKFIYEGSGDIVVHYLSPDGDDGTVGGAAVLNGFKLRLPAGGVPFAFKPKPPNGAVDVHPDVVLSWNPGGWAAQHDVYFGTSYEDVNDGIPGSDVHMGQQDPNWYDAGRLQLGQTYYWRIDEVNDANSDSPWRGRVWRFTVDDGKASNPSPGDKAENVARDAVLTWEPGSLAASHDVYFGTLYRDVRDGTAFIGNQTDPNYDPPNDLELGQTYYWRIDEINPGYTDSTGDVWSFTVIAYIVVEDVESYQGSLDLTGTWEDGFGNWTGSTLLLALAPEFPVNSGSKSMEFEYDNDGEVGGWPADEYSLIERMFSQLQDWTEADVKILRLYFYGQENNAAGVTEQMYVGVKDTTGKYAEVRYALEDMDDIKKEEWQHWDIALPDFTGVDLKNIKNLLIGFGDSANPQAGLGGTIYFDDIRLYGAFCVPEEGPAADFSGDCFVDEKDLKVMAEQWLESDGSLPAVEPNPAGLRAWYEFNRTAGNDAIDSSGNGYDGTVDPNGVDNWDPNGKSGYCLNFDETFGVEIPADIFTEIDTAITITVWLNGDKDQNDVDNVIFQAGGANNGLEHIISIRTRWQSGSIEWRTGQFDRDRAIYNVSSTEDWAGQWNHYAFVKDASAGKAWIYHNGLLVAEGTGTASMSGVAKAKIGEASEREGDNYRGKVDDLRIYNYALSQAEIASVMGLTELYLPLPEPQVDLELDGKVNFKDYAHFANSWLEKKMWP